MRLAPLLIRCSFQLLLSPSHHESQIVPALSRWAKCCWLLYTETDGPLTAAGLFGVWPPGMLICCRLQLLLSPSHHESQIVPALSRWAKCCWLLYTETDGPLTAAGLFGVWPPGMLICCRLQLLLSPSHHESQIVPALSRWAKWCWLLYTEMNGPLTAAGLFGVWPPGMLICCRLQLLLSPSHHESQ